MPHYRFNVNCSTSAPKEGFFNDKELELVKRAQKLGHSRKTITGREVFLGQGGLYEHETLVFFNTDLTYNQQWHELQILGNLVSEVKQIWHVARVMTISLMTIFIGSKVIYCLVRVFHSIGMLRSGINHVIALQPINPLGELVYFQHLTQRNKEQRLTGKRTVEWCDGNTNIVVIKAKMSKSGDDMTEIEIDTLDYFKCMICRNGRTKNRQLLLLSTRVDRSEVDSQAPSVSDCWSNLK